MVACYDERRRGTLDAPSALMIDTGKSDEDSTACVLYSGPGIEPDTSGAPWRPAEELFAGVTSPAVLLVDASLLERIGDLQSLPSNVVIVAGDRSACHALGRRAEMSLAETADKAARREVLRAACLLATARSAATHSEEEFQELNRIGIGLMGERDRKALLRQIVVQGKRLTHSDGGGLALLKADGDGRQWLHPVLYQFDSIDYMSDAPLSIYPVDESSVLGHAALTKHPVVVGDVYELQRDAIFEEGIAFDKRYGYRRRSMLVVPMVDQLDHVLGVLVFVNRKTDPNARITSKEAADRYVIAYSDHEVRLARALASQCAVAIENVRLYARIQRTLESFVAASVSAIDLRDPTMAGHSLRVAALATGLAEAVERSGAAPFRDVRFTPSQLRELRFAALLHDFGKVAVREELLLKAKKLPPVLWERIDRRFDQIRRTMELEFCRARANGGAADGDAALRARLEELERARQVVREANEPSFLHPTPPAGLLEIAQRTFEPCDGTIAPYITPEELHFLQLAHGTLDDQERAEVEAHVTKTFVYLSGIPWTDDLKNLATYAYGHHEKLNGSGYPRHLTSDDIPIQVRIITIADMFDALTASDRPYKPAITADQALDVLRSQGEAGLVDPDLVKVMTESRTYQIVETNWTEP
jgi:HD-GYP domain-containing protein (c-di-GMP phosphodiesterase class II)